MMTSKQRLYLTAGKDALVAHGDEAAAFLYAAIGDEIPDDAVERFGLVDGLLPGFADEAAAEAERLATEEAAARLAAAKAIEREAAARAEADAAAKAEADAAAKAEADAAAKAEAGAAAKAEADATAKAEADAAAKAKAEQKPARSPRKKAD